MIGVYFLVAASGAYLVWLWYSERRSRDEFVQRRNSWERTLDEIQALPETESVEAE
jgi:hypothetical protein